MIIPLGSLINFQQLFKHPLFVGVLSNHKHINKPLSPKYNESTKKYRENNQKKIKEYRARYKSIKEKKQKDIINNDKIPKGENL